GHQPPPTLPPRRPHPRSTDRERSPPRTADGAPDVRPADAPATASPADQPDPTSASSRSSQLPSVERCDERLNPTCETRSMPVHSAATSASIEICETPRELQMMA